MTRRRIVTWGVVLAVLVAGGFGYQYYRSQQRALPAGIISSNGRVEADEIGIATKYPGRVVELKFQEGDLVKPGQILARMDTGETEAQLRSAEAVVVQRGKERDAAQDQVNQRQSQYELAQSELKRALVLVSQSAISQQRADQLKTLQDTTQSALAAANAQLQGAQAAIASAQAEADRLKHQIDDATLVAPKPGRMLYKLADIGETLPAGGAVGQMIDLSDVYFTMFLPSAQAARASIGAAGRIVLDAVPSRPIPAKVSYVSPQAQFTPKQVETQTERERMTYRVKLRVPPALVDRYIDQVKTGITGMGYVRLDAKAEWPSWLESDLTASPEAK